MNSRLIPICLVLIFASCQRVTEWKKFIENMGDKGEKPANSVDLGRAVDKIGYYTVNGDVDAKAYFHSKPDKATIRKAYLIKGEQVYIQKIESGFGYAEFTNAQGKVTKGWIDLLELNLSRRINDK